MQVKSNVAFLYNEEKVEIGQTLELEKPEALELIRKGLVFATNLEDLMDHHAESIRKAALQ